MDRWVAHRTGGDEWNGLAATRLILRPHFEHLSRLQSVGARHARDFHNCKTSSRGLKNTVGASRKLLSAFSGARSYRWLAQPVPSGSRVAVIR
jgi:hypothetical protein